MSNENTSIVTTSSTDFPISADLMSVMFNDSGKGAEEAGAESLTIPVLYLAQAISSAVQDSGAKAGDIVNTATGESFHSLEIAVCNYKRRYTRWNQDGSFGGVYSAVEVETDRVPNAKVFKKGYDFCIQDENGTSNLTDTRVFYVMYSEEGADSWRPAVINMSRTQIKAAKRLMTLIKTTEFKGPNGQSFNPASWAVIYKASSLSQSNEKGRWFGWDFKRGCLAGKELYFKCQDFYKSVSENEVQAAEPEPEYEAGSFHAQQQAQQGFNQSPYGHGFAQTGKSYGYDANDKIPF